MLARHGAIAVYHYTPLHYLPFIARQGALLSKTQLSLLGFADTHFRRTSRLQDEQRGFASYVHLTLDAHPPLLQAKLAGGFPHFEVAVPAAHFDDTEYALCRFNIAKARYFRGAKQEPPESDANGRYYDGMRLPTARTPMEREGLLRHNLGRNMIEVLVPEQVPLPSGTTFRFFHDEDFHRAMQVLRNLRVSAYGLERDAQLTYQPAPHHRASTEDALARAVANEAWRGSGLDFDRV